MPPDDDAVRDGSPHEAVRPFDDRVPPGARTWRDLAGEAVLLLPNLLKLLNRLFADPRVPLRRKVFLAAVIVYVVSPIDLIPDFFVGIGQLDDILLVSLAVDHLLKGADADVLRQHWDGSDDSLDLVRSVSSWMSEIVPKAIRNRLPG